MDPWPDIPDRVHLIGIGGSGMAALAHCLLDMNRFVCGSDLYVTPETEQLCGRGADMQRQTFPARRWWWSATRSPPTTSS